MKRKFLVILLLWPLAACSLLYPGFSSREPSIAKLEVGKTTYRQASGMYGTPAVMVMDYPRSLRMTYLFRTPEAIIDRGAIMRGSYKEGCRKCGELMLVFERTDRSVDNMVLAGFSRSTPALQAQFAAGFEHISRGDFQAALPLIEAAAGARYSEAEFTLGLMHLRGDGVPQDYQKARYWFGRAAAANHTRARYDLGAMYRNGEGVPVNREAAKALFQMAAQAGYAPAAEELATLYGEEGDFVNAGKWLEAAKRAAEASTSP